MWPTPFFPKWTKVLLGAGALVFIAGMMPVRADETPIDEVGGDPAVTIDPTVEVSPHDQDVNMGTIQTGSFYGNLPWEVHANGQVVRFWAAVSPLYKDDDPTNPAVTPIMPSETYGVLIEASHGVWVDANFHAYVDTTTIDGFPCLVTEAIDYSSGDDGTWSYPCMTTVKWDQPDPEKPPGEYSGRVRFYASYVGLSHAAQELLGFGAYRADHDFGTARCVVTINPQCPDGESYTDCRTIADSGILFAERYSTEADSVVPPGQPMFYDSTRVVITRDPGTRFYISGRPDTLSPWVCDDVLVITDLAGVDQAPEFGHSELIDPSLPLCRPIENIITILPGGDITPYVPMGTHCVTFKLADTQRGIFGNTAIYLVRVSDPTDVVPFEVLDFQKIRVTPNPTGSATTVNLCTRDSGLHTLTIHAPDGRVVRTFPQMLLGRGQRQAWFWDSRDQAGRVVSPGVYFCSIQTPTERLSARVLVIR